MRIRKNLTAICFTRGESRCHLVHEIQWLTSNYCIQGSNINRWEIKMEMERRAGWGKDAVRNKRAEPRVYVRERRVLRLCVCVCVFFCNCGGAWITLLCSDLAEFRLFRYVCSFSLPFDDFEVTFCAQNNCLSMFLPGSNRLRCRRSWFCTSYSLVIASYRICRHCFFFLFVMLLFSIAWMAAVYAPSFNRSRFDKFLG